MKNYKIGLQLFSIQEEMFDNPDATLKAVAKMGYECVEFARDLFGHPAEELKKLCEKYGLEPVSAHHNFSDMLENPAPHIEKFKTLGLKFVAIPFVSSCDWVNDKDALLEKVKRFVKVVTDNGMIPVYHNHDHEFLIEVEGKPAIEWLLENAEGLSPEFDTCWVHYGMKNPCDVISKYADRQEIIHFKDFECTNIPDGMLYESDCEIKFSKDAERVMRRDMEAEGFVFKPIGYGRQDIKKMLEAVENSNIKYVIVEQDKHTERTPMEDVKLSVDYIRSLGC